MKMVGCRIYTDTQQSVPVFLAFPYNGTALSMPLWTFTPSVLRSSSLQSCVGHVLRAQAPGWALVWGRHMAPVLNSLEGKEKALKKPAGWLGG